MFLPQKEKKRMVGEDCLHRLLFFCEFIIYIFKFCSHKKKYLMYLTLYIYKFDCKFYIFIFLSTENREKKNHIFYF